MSTEYSILEGIKVVEAATMIMVPTAAMVMSDFGADVTKVEPRGTGDNYRDFHLLKGLPETNVPYPFLMDNRNKKSLAIDLKNPEGMEILKKMLKTADVFMTNYRPQALERLGISWEELHELNPRLIFAYANGYGEKGPDAQKPGYDVVSYWARSGMEFSGLPFEGWPRNILPGTGDHPTGMTLFAGIMMALFERERTGEGRKVTTSLMAAGTFANSCIVGAAICDAEFMPIMPREDAYNFSALYYYSKDRELFKMAIVNMEKRWPPLCRALGRPDLIDDPKFATQDARQENMAEIIRIVETTLASEDMIHWERKLEEADIPFSTPSNYDMIKQDPQMYANDVFIEIEDPEFGKTLTVNSPIEIHGAPKVKPKTAPRLGQHSKEVVAELGFSSDEIDDLISRGIIDDIAK
jgi:crotonobetainyl-CoA:carnitine CoA-transferase CaiB-like acyl-CoA transferase